MSCFSSISVGTTRIWAIFLRSEDCSCMKSRSDGAMTPPCPCDAYFAELGWPEPIMLQLCSLMLQLFSKKSAPVSRFSYDINDR